jgi:hypothetical protein
MKNTFERIVLPLFGVFGTLITFLTFVFPAYANIKLPLSLYVITILVLSLVIAVVTKIAIDLRSESFNRSFNNFKITPMQYVESEHVFLVDKSIALPLNSSTTVYVREGLFEKAVALGFVSHIQDEFIQIKIFGLLEKSTEIYKTELKNISIRPTSNVNDIIRLVTEGVNK